MVADQQEGAREAERPHDGGQADLGGLVDDRDVEQAAAGQQRVAAGEAGRGDDAGAGGQLCELGGGGERVPAAGGGGRAGMSI